MIKINTGESIKNQIALTRWWSMNMQTIITKTQIEFNEKNNQISETEKENQD